MRFLSGQCKSASAVDWAKGQNRNFGGAVQTDRHVDRPDASTDEDPRVLATPASRDDGKLASGDRADSGQHDLTTVRVAAQN